MSDLTIAMIVREAGRLHHNSSWYLKTMRAIRDREREWENMLYGAPITPYEIPLEDYEE